MRLESEKQSFGHDLVEAMKLITAHLRGEIELEQACPKRFPPKGVRKPKLPIKRGSNE